MIIIEEKKKKNFLFSFNKFLFLYFFITLIIGLILAGFIFSSYTFSKAKNKFLLHFSKAGRYEYLYLPKIALEAIKSNFYKINNPNNLEKITRTFFNQRRKMIKKPFSQIFKNPSQIVKKLNIDLNLRPQNLSPDTYYKITKEYENLRS